MEQSKKKVIVFGGSGFVGSHTADSLTERGYDVTIFDLKESLYLKDSQKMIIGDILNYNDVLKSISGHKFVYNFSGISDIDECHNNPLETIKYNILGNANVIKASIEKKALKYMFASSAYVTSSSGSFYRISKLSSEQIIEEFSKEFKISYVLLRYGSLYGERSDRRNSIYRIIEEALCTNKIEYYGDGGETREFIHVKDAADLSVDALDNKYNGEVLLLSSDEAMKYKELLETVNEILDKKVKIVIKPSTEETHYRMSPYSFKPITAKKILKNPHIDLGQGLLNLIFEIHSKIDRDKLKSHDLQLKK